MVVGDRRCMALNGFTFCGKAENAGQVERSEHFSARQEVFKSVQLLVFCGSTFFGMRFYKYEIFTNVALFSIMFATIW